MSPAPPAQADAQPATPPDFFNRSRPVWHWAFFGLLAAMAVLALVQSFSPTERLVMLLALAVMALAYALVGHRAVGRDDTRLALAYLVPAWGALLLIATLEPAALLLLFALFPQTWAMLPHIWQAVTWTVVAAGLLAVIQVATSGGTGQARLEAGLSFVFTVGLSLLLGLWITGISRESERRAELIEELSRTRVDLAEAEHSRGALAERERLAHEIHDTLAQGFTSILALSQAIDAGWESDPQGSRERLHLLAQTARENLAEARSLVTALRPVDLEDADLAAALERVVQRFARECGVRVSLEVTGHVRPLPANTEVVLLRSAQEALANIRRHAEADTATVRLHYAPAVGDGPAATLEVVDDGRGLPDGTVEGFGLRGMRERAARVGGQVVIDEAGTGGTRVHVDVG